MARIPWLVSLSANILPRIPPAARIIIPKRNSDPSRQHLPGCPFSSQRPSSLARPKPAPSALPAVQDLAFPSLQCRLSCILWFASTDLTVWKTLLQVSVINPSVTSAPSAPGPGHLGGTGLVANYLSDAVEHLSGGAGAWSWPPQEGSGDPQGARRLGREKMDK